MSFKYYKNISISMSNNEKNVEPVKAKKFKKIKNKLF